MSKVYVTFTVSNNGVVVKEIKRKGAISLSKMGDKYAPIKKGTQWNLF